MIGLALLACALAGPGGDGLLRPAAARRLAQRVGVSRLDELPAHRVALSLDDAAGTVSGTAHLTWHHDGDAPRAAFPFVLPANAADPRVGGHVEVVDVRVRRGPPARFTLEGPVGELIFDRPIAPGEEVEVSFVFDGRLGRLGDGLDALPAQLARLDAREGHGLFAQGDGLVAAVAPWPMLAPLDGPSAVVDAGAVGTLSWNRLAWFDVEITVPDGLVVVTNLADGRPRDLGDGRRRLRATGAGARELALVAGRDLVVRRRRARGVAVRSWARADHAEGAEAALDEAAAAVRRIARIAGPAPFRELDVAEASLVGGAGGFEFSGMVLVASFLYAPADGGAPWADGMRPFTVAHEVAHQWAPGLVAGDPRRHPVLDEALAQYLASRVVDGADPDRPALARQARLSYAAMRLIGAPDGPADRPASEYPDALTYSGLVYGKAPYAYVAMEQAAGRAALDRGLRRAFRRHAWGVVDAAGWLDALEAGGVDGAGAVGRRWWDAAHGDEDLGVDASGEAIVRLMLPPDEAEAALALARRLGLPPAEVLRALIVGGLPGAAPGAAPRAE